MITANSVFKTFFQAGNAIPVLKNVSVQMTESETLAVVGPSGSGKTTFLSLLAGLELPDKGEIFINDKKISMMTEGERARFRAQYVGIVFQQFHLMPHLTALENVSLPLEILKDPNAFQKAREQLKRVNLEHRQNHLPAQLSGGECQRVAIARASVTQPKVLFADEPSGNLDRDSGRQALDLLFSLVKENKTTMVLVTHNHELANRCTRQMELLNNYQPSN